MACRQSAPGLVQAYHKYSDRGVRFVSLTNESREQTEQFVRQTFIPWACGYGATLEGIARWGVYTTSRMSANYNPGYEVSPTVFLIGSDGRILWCDGQIRPRHLGKPEELIRRVETAIEEALAAS